MKKFSFALVLLSLIALSCSSPLSDVNITDPSLLEPQLVVTKSIGLTGNRSVVYTADIYDKNFNLVTLQNGSVKINGFNMNERANLFGGEEYYLQGESEVKFALDDTYTFTLTLSDGSKYYGKVTSQSEDLTEFVVPSSQSRTQPINVSWKNTDPNATMSIELVYKFSTDSSSGTGSQIINIGNPASESYSISPSVFTTTQGKTTEVDLTLVSKITGTIDPGFRGGSSTVCKLTIEKDVILN